MRSVSYSRFTHVFEVGVHQADLSGYFTACVLLRDAQLSLHHILLLLRFLVC
jgi:hypothetical protein